MNPHTAYEREQPAYATGDVVTAAMRDIYWWMTAGLALTGVVAMLVARSPAAKEIVFKPGVLIGLIIGEFALVIGISWGLRRISASTATALFLLYAAVNGLTLSVIFLVYTSGSIASTFFVTAGTFGAMAIYGTVTKRDLTGMGQFAIMGLFGVIIASVVNIFVHSELLYWGITYAGVLVFVLLTAYDVQKLRKMAAAGALPAQKLAIFGALNLYLDFINLFLMLLRVLGDRR